MSQTKQKVADPHGGAVKVDDPAPASPSRSKLSWVTGWVIVPGFILSLIVGGGAWVGAHRPDSWFTRLVLWVVELF